MQHFGSKVIRVTKNYTKGYSDTQAKVRDATSNDPWGPSGTQMNEIAQLTYNQNDFIEIMEMIDKRLNDKGKNWRHVFKSLTVLDYCLHQGSENCVIYFRDNIYVIKTLKEFQYVDEDGKDQGANVRQKAKDITNLLQDESRLREERRTRASMRDRMIRGAGGPEGDDEPMDENAQRRQGNNGLAGKRPNRDEDELRQAIEESKKSLAQERLTAEERDLQQALKLSKEEEEKRKHDVESSNAAALFDDANQLPSPNAASNNPFPLIDPTPYAVGLQPQFTMQPQFTSMQPQFTAFNPYQQQAQAEQEAAQAEYLRQQQLFMLQQQQAQQQQQQQQQQQEAWMRQQQLLQMQQQQQQQNLFAPQQPLQVQPTGFGNNNPFAPASPSSLSPSPRPSTNTSPTFNLQGTYDNHSNSHLSSLSSSPQPPSQSSNQGRPFAVKKRDNENEALAALFADREGGQDTFGNTGALRYGYTEAGRSVMVQKTGHNPFAQQQQQQQNSAERPFFDI
ncbi:hypothetical protein CVT25_007737 [Psilocybe cyanescens]|uniref:ENTH domain-containing protein n=1 Tax=Psilocybe cyanescens TaxID=93625 RepID=A0A409XHU2_PSICY|nr:hypothetical protein CVT25_007737 [Psilocybe cyanescens]